jgi:L,D-transpeptidase ErfK/SrfK
MKLKLILTSVLLPLLSAVAASSEYALSPDSDVIGEIQVIRAVHEDTFVGLARRFDVGIEELRRANPGVDAWLPGEGTEIIIPTRFVLPDAPRQGIVVNIPEYRLYYFPDGDGPDGDAGPGPGGSVGRVITHPIGIGRQGWDTPYGATSVVRKKHLPTWTPPDSVREEHAARGDILPAVVAAGPDNPLGEHALYLGFSSYLIHGTNDARGVGMRVSHGCIRMFPEDIASLFQAVEPGVPVRIVNQPYKLGWGEGGLFLEAHPPLVEESEEWTATELTRLYVGATGERSVQVRWNQADAVMTAGSGMPEFVSVEGTITVADLGDDTAGEVPDEESSDPLFD